MKIRCMNCMKEYENEDHVCPVCGYKQGTLPDEIYHLYPETLLAGRYVVGTVVAYGGFGILYRAWDQKLEVMVAIKEYFPSVYVNRNPGEKEIFIYTGRKKEEFEQGRKGFLDEARNTAKFSAHPNIVNVYDYFEENGTAYMVMEYMKGVTLKEYTKKQGGKIPWEKAVEIGCCMCDVLKDVHAVGILHRDISPDNIMMCEDGSIKLFDFGAARFSDVDNEVARTIILKMGFAPPEQYLKKSRQGPWTDIYALGATIYRSMTGKLPDESVNRKEAVSQKEEDPLVPPQKLVPEIPDYLNIALVKSMAIQPELRFKHVMQFKDALLNRKQYVDIEEELKRKKKIRTMGIAMILMALCFSTLGCFRFYQKKHQEANLGETTIQLWMPLKPGESAEEQQELYARMSEEFLTDYPKVHLEFRCIPEADYQTELITAQKSGEFPVLFESSGLKEPFGNRMETLDGVFSLMNEEDYRFIGSQPDMENLRTQIPLGFLTPVLYGNSSLIADETFLEAENDVDRFLKGRSMVMIGDYEDYGEVQQSLPGLYEILVLPGSLYGCYECLWSVDSQAEELQKLAAERLLYYFLGENAQDIRHIQNETAFPVNQNELEIFLEINQELAFLKEQLQAGDNMELIQGDKASFYDQLYEKRYQEDSFRVEELQQQLKER